MNRGSARNFLATELNSVLGKKGRKQLFWTDGAIGTLANPVTYAAPVLAGMAIGRNIKLDGRPLGSMDSNKTVIEVPLKNIQPNKDDKTAAVKDGIYKQANSLNNLNHQHNYIHSYEKTILKDGIVGPAMKGLLMTAPFLALAHFTGRNFRNYGEKIDTSEDTPVAPGKARVIIETKSNPNSGDGMNNIAGIKDESLYKTAAKIQKVREITEAMKNKQFNDRVTELSKTVALPLGTIAVGIAAHNVYRDKKKKSTPRPHFDRPHFDRPQFQKPYERKNRGH